MGEGCAVAEWSKGAAFERESELNTIRTQVLNPAWAILKEQETQETRKNENWTIFFQRKFERREKRMRATTMATIERKKSALTKTFHRLLPRLFVPGLPVSALPS